MNTLSVTFFLRNNTAIYCRVKVNSLDAKDINTGLTTSHVMAWAGSSRLFTDSSDESFHNNMEIAKVRHKLEKLFEPYKSEGLITSKRLKDLYLGEPEKQITGLPDTIIKATEYYIAQKQLEGSLRNNSVNNYHKHLKTFIAFLKEYYNVEDIELKKLTPIIIREYYAFLASRGNTIGTRAAKIKSISTVINYVMNDFTPDQYPGFITWNPCKGAIKNNKKEKKTSRDKSLKNYLPPEMEKEWREVQLDDPMTDVFRWIALLQWNTGLSFSDLGNDEWSEINIDVDGYKYITYGRQKTDETAIIPILADAEMIFKKLHELKEKHGYKRLVPLHRFHTANGDINLKQHNSEYLRYRYHLSKICKALDIPMIKGTHTFRHSFGVKMESLGFDAREIAKMFGHTTSFLVETTYVPVTHKKIAERVKELQNSKAS